MCRPKLCCRRWNAATNDVRLMRRCTFILRPLAGTPDWYVRFPANSPAQACARHRHNWFKLDGSEWTGYLELRSWVADGHCSCIHNGKSMPRIKRLLAKFWAQTTEMFQLLKITTVNIKCSVNTLPAEGLIITRPGRGGNLGKSAPPPAIWAPVRGGSSKTPRGGSWIEVVPLPMSKIKNPTDFDYLILVVAYFQFLFFYTYLFLVSVLATT